MIYDDDKVFDIDGVSIIPNMDIFLEILSGTDKCLFAVMCILFAVAKTVFGSSSGLLSFFG